MDFRLRRKIYPWFPLKEVSEIKVCQNIHLFARTGFLINKNEWKVNVANGHPVKLILRQTLISDTSLKGDHG